MTTGCRGGCANLLPQRRRRRCRVRPNGPIEGSGGRTRSMWVCGRTHHFLGATALSTMCPLCEPFTSEPKASLVGWQGA
eukprot:127764-Pyramimonas_sp.AAC.1